MRITLTRGGGFTGIKEELGPLDTEELAADLAGRITAKIEEIRFFELPDRIPGEPKTAEAVWHRIAVADGERENEVTYDSRSDPSQVASLDELRDLVEKSGMDYRPAGRGVAQ
jgi:hypothetical protein